MLDSRWHHAAFIFLLTETALDLQTKPYCLFLGEDERLKVTVFLPRGLSKFWTLKQRKSVLSVMLSCLSAPGSYVFTFLFLFIVPKCCLCVPSICFLPSFFFCTFLSTNVKCCYFHRPTAYMLMYRRGSKEEGQQQFSGWVDGCGWIILGLPCNIGWTWEHNHRNINIYLLEIIYCHIWFYCTCWIVLGVI